MKISLLSISQVLKQIKYWQKAGANLVLIFSDPNVRVAGPAFPSEYSLTNSKRIRNNDAYSKKEGRSQVTSTPLPMIQNFLISIKNTPKRSLETFPSKRKMNSSKLFLYLLLQAWVTPFFLRASLWPVASWTLVQAR